MGDASWSSPFAQYPDASNLNVVEPGQVAHKLDVLRRHCDALGRDYANIEKTMQTSAWDPVADPEAFLRFAEDVAAVGMVGGEFFEGTPKSHRIRDVPMPPFLRDELARRVAGLRPDDLVFPSSSAPS